MKIDFKLENAVKKRYSVRNYSDKEISSDIQKSIRLFVDSLDNPFGKKVNFHYFGSEHLSGDKLRGSYGIIKGAKQYIGATIKLEPLSLEALGYEVEALMLYLANLDIGTCWLGKTFDQKGFFKSLDVEEGEILPIVTPYGYASDKKRVKDIFMRKIAVSHKRKPWDTLFFKDSFNTPLTQREAFNFEFALEMVRLAPSAVNKQPWRIVLRDNIWHFYEEKTLGFSGMFPYDIQRIDIGIAAAHFDLAVKEQGMQGNFEILKHPTIEIPKNMEYVFSWIREE